MNEIDIEVLWEKHSESVEIIECDQRGDRVVMKKREFKEALTKLLAELRKSYGWVSVTEKLPEDVFNVMVWVPNQTPREGYWDLASYGEWFCEDEDCHPGDPNYVADNDEGNRRGFGWHRTEETHGGPYDYVTIDLNGKVTYWRPLPAPPIPSAKTESEA